MVKRIFGILILVTSICAWGITPEEELLLQQIVEKTEFDIDNLKRQEVVFNFGTNIATRNQFYMGENGEYFNLNGQYALELAPKDLWSSLNSITLWGSMVFEEGNFIKLALDATMLLHYDSIIPVFNISELYLSWKYPLGHIHIGRKTYALNSQLNFTGLLDGLSIEINAPVLTFKSFIGFSGFTGIFHPWYNSFNISEYDNSYEEKTNLKDLFMVIQLNGEQSRRFFLSTDFDISYLFFTFNPYFLMQLDVSNLALPNFNNTDYTINTFTIGLLTKIRIWSPLYLFLDITGVFGAIQDLHNEINTPISSFAFNAELRYTFTATSNTAFSLTYGLGSGTENEKLPAHTLQTSAATSNRFIYFGEFQGGFVLDPLLYNIHSIGAKFLTNINKKVAFYAHYYQTLKMFPESPISEANASGNSYLVSSEIDSGLAIAFNENVHLSLDAGLLIPLEAFIDKTFRFKTGLAFIINL